MEKSNKNYILKAFRCSDDECEKIKKMVSDLKNTTGIDMISEAHIIRKSINEYYNIFTRKINA